MKYRLRAHDMEDAATIKRSGFSTTDIWAILGWMNDGPDIDLPYGEALNLYWIDVKFQQDQELRITKADWDGYQWNPPDRKEAGRIYETADPDASPKPSWDDFIAWVEENDIWKLKHPADRDASEASYVLAELTDETALDVGDQELHVGGGLSHMVGLIQMAGDADTAGVSLPAVVLRDSANKPKKVHRQSEVREILRLLSGRENAFESAHNSLRERYDALAARRDDFSLSDAERLKAGREARDMMANYKALLVAEVATFDPDALPDDLPTLKAVLVERLEAATTGRQKSLKGALTQQAIDNWAACVDLDEALQEVAKQCVLGGIAIERCEDTIWKRAAGAWAVATEAADLTAEPDHEGDEAPDATIGADGDTYLQTGTGIAAAKAAFDAAVAEIEVVTPMNVPEWSVDGAEAEGPTPAAAVDKRTATVIARNPNDEIEGSAVIGLYTASYADGSGPVFGIGFRRLEVQGEPDAHAVFVQLPGSVTKAVRMTIFAKNLCGPSSLELTLTPPAD